MVEEVPFPHDPLHLCHGHALCRSAERTFRGYMERYRKNIKLDSTECDGCDTSALMVRSFQRDRRKRHSAICRINFLDACHRFKKLRGVRGLVRDPCDQNGNDDSVEGTGSYGCSLGGYPNDDGTGETPPQGEARETTIQEVGQTHPLTPSRCCYAYCDLG